MRSPVQIWLAAPKNPVSFDAGFFVMFFNLFWPVVTLPHSEENENSFKMLSFKTKFPTCKGSKWEMETSEGE